MCPRREVPLSDRTRWFRLPEEVRVFDYCADRRLQRATEEGTDAVVSQCEGASSRGVTASIVSGDFVCISVVATRKAAFCDYQSPDRRGHFADGHC